MEMKQAIKDAPEHYLQSSETAATKQSNANTQHNCCCKWHERKPSNEVRTLSYNSQQLQMLHYSTNNVLNSVI